MLEKHLKFYYGGLLNRVVNIETLVDMTNFFYNKPSPWADRAGFGYAGEALERFEERKACTTTESLRAFVLAATASQFSHFGNFEHYDDQKERFGERVLNAKKFNNDGLVQLLVHAWNHKNGYKTNFSNDYMENLKTSDEILVALAIFDFFELMKGEPSHVSQLMSRINVNDLKEKDVYDRADALKPLIQLYDATRPKKSEFKKNVAIYDYVLSAWRLTKKEIKTEVSTPSWENDFAPSAKALQTDASQTLTLHYLLIEWSPEFVKVPEIAKERLFVQLVQHQLTQQNQLDEKMKDLIQKTKMDITFIWAFLPKVKSSNLAFVFDLTDGFKNIPATRETLSMIENPIYTDSILIDLLDQIVRNEIGKDTLHFLLENTPLSEKIELIRKRLTEEHHYPGLLYRPGETYVHILMNHKIYNCYEDFVSLNIESSFKSYLKSSWVDADTFLKHALTIPLEQTDFIGTRHRTYYSNSSNTTYFNPEKYQTLTNKSDYVTLILKVVNFHEPKAYGDLIFKLASDGILKEIGISENAEENILKHIYDNKLYRDNHVAYKLKERFTSEEVKRQEQMANVLQELNVIKSTTLITHYLNKAIPFKDEPIVQQAIRNIFKADDFKTQDLYSIFEWIDMHYSSQEDVYEKMIQALKPILLKSAKANPVKLKFYELVRDTHEEAKKQINNEEMLACQQA